MSAFIDIHTHFAYADKVAIIDISAQGASPTIGDAPCSYGVHPYFITDDYVMRLETLYRLAANGQLTAIGECGFDHRASTDIKLQRSIFEKHISISEQFHLPLIIHCVKGFPELISCHKQFRPKQAWIVHGYNNKETVLKQLLDCGIYLSLGKALLFPNSNARLLAKNIPQDKLFIETDDVPLSIEELYSIVAAQRGISIDELKTQIEANFKHVIYDNRK
ncbi:MAG: TatD family hydrolase [Marinifilaceae bacterium]